jgi:hypothetical protein
MGPLNSFIFVLDFSVDVSSHTPAGSPDWLLHASFASKTSFTTRLLKQSTSNYVKKLQPLMHFSANRHSFTSEMP